MRIRLCCLLLMANIARAEVVVLDELPHRMIMPCVREIALSELTRAVIPMIPWRGVNLMFPFELSPSATNYTLSGGDVWEFDPALKESNIVPVNFKAFDPVRNWGTVQDLTISTKGYVVSIALHAVQDPEAHCTNIQFTLSDEEKQRVEQASKKQYLDVLKRDYQAKLAELEQVAGEKALLLVASLAQDKPKRGRIKEEDSIVLPNGDDAVVYVKESKVYGRFSTISFDIENYARKEPLYIEAVEIIKEGENQPLKGVFDLAKKIPADSQIEGVFVTREVLNESNMMLRVRTDQGTIEVLW
ncbi:MAG: hypothetical protein KUG81_10525 [Gammaproteobacteria bacterium]|nr:hypothetical protein [Gammaproteobacteria bacterium]